MIDWLRQPRRAPFGGLPLTLIGVAVLVLAGGYSGPEIVHGTSTLPVIQLEAETVLEGNLEIITEDSDQGSRTLYFLIFEDRRVALRFTTGNPLNLTTGTRVRVRGRWDPDETLVVTAIEKL